VKSIVDLHGGSAVIESTVGRGATVKLTFPLL
jgi:signal transduction histidine kinase